MKVFEYQLRAIDELTVKIVKLLNEGGNRHKLVFEAPTGSGKTVMACQALANIVDALKTDGRNRYEDVAFIWFAPRKLHLQSYNSLKGAFANGRELRPVMFDDIEKSEGIQSGEILFVNWESVNKDSNIMARDGECSPSIYEVCRITKEQMKLPIVAIIDEEHVFWSKTADKSAAVLDRINPDVEIRISATPKTVRYDEKVRVSRKEVIDAGMIKREVLLNGDIDSGISDETVLNNHLMAKAIAKREQLAQAYHDLGLDINPLLLIQLPNDTKETMTTEDAAIADFVERYLSATKGITTDNGKLAVWLANRKDNLSGISGLDNMVEVLLFKEAIALGWDCPRAAVLLIFRKLSGNEFTVQTVGRILRMPEQRHYTDGRLNIGYVYTDIAKDKINVIATDADYLKKNAILACRRNDIENITLKSTYAERPNDTRNYFGPDFREVLYKESERFWNVTQSSQSLFTLGELIAMRDDDEPKFLPKSENDHINENRRRIANTIRLDVTKINVPVPKDIHFQNEVQEIEVDRSVKFARSSTEIDRVFISFISSYIGGFENKNNPADKLAGYLLETLADLFGIYDTDAKKVVLYHENRSKFDRLIRLSLEKYAKVRDDKKKKAAARVFKEWEWSIPEERLYDDETHHIREVKNHALIPFVELNSASKTAEKPFIDFLESNTKYIEWWYKNGDSGRQNYAVPYDKGDGTKSCFYVDFIIKLRNGKVFLFDTKTADSEPLTAYLKHNALIEYISRENERGENQLAGGVIVLEGENWLWSRSKIENTTDHEEWDYFDPKRENAT